VVHPTVASLNSLAQILRQAAPLYIECRSILHEAQRFEKRADGLQCNSTKSVLAATDRRPTIEDEDRTKRSGYADANFDVNSTSGTAALSPSHRDLLDRCSDRSSRALVAKQVWEPHNEPTEHLQIDSHGPSQISDVFPRIGDREDLNARKPMDQTGSTGAVKPRTVYTLPQRFAPSNSLQNGRQTPIHDVVDLACDKPLLTRRNGTTRVPKSRTVLCDPNLPLVSPVLMSRYNREALYERVPLFLNGVFIALSVPTLGGAAFALVTDQETSSARAIFYGLRQFGTSVGVTVAVILVDRRSALHSGRLLEAFFNRSLAPISQTQEFSAEALKTFEALIRKQSLVLAFSDVFYVMAAIAALSLLTVPLLPVPNPGRAASHADEKSTSPKNLEAISAKAL
jgi:hypothetical protein